MAEKQLKTRIQQKYDSYDNWMLKGNNIILKRGEIAICKAPAGIKIDNYTTKEPKILIKVGDGTSTFAQLKWVDTIAMDIDNWAKKPEAEFVEWIKELIDTNSIDLSNYYTKAEVDSKVEVNTNIISSHIENKNNPHEVTAEQIGASSVSHNHDNRYMLINEKASVVQGRVLGGISIQAKSYIEPIQEGVGEPSLENVRPLKGWTDIKMVQCGKNFAPSLDNDSKNGITVEKIDEGRYHVFGTSTSSLALFTLRKGKLSLKTGSYVVSVGDNLPVGVRLICDYYKGSEYNGSFCSVPSGKSYASCSVPKEKETDTIESYFRIESGTTVDFVYYFQIETGSIATPYEPYAGDTYIEQFQETVYGGTYDWSTGSGISDYAFIEFNGDSAEKWYDQGDGRYTYNLGNKTSAGIDGSLSNWLKPSSDTVTLNTFTFTGPNKEYLSIKTPFKTVAELRESLKKAPLQVAYKLKSGVEFSGDSVVIKSFSGTNTLYSYTGDTVIYGGRPIVDSELNSNSTNPVQNKVINTALSGKASTSSLTSHTGNKNNPHKVTATQIGALTNNSIINGGSW